MPALLPNILETLPQQVKDSIDDIAKTSPAELQNVWDLATMFGDVATQFYVAKMHLQHMPARLHVYLGKLVSITELMQKDDAPTALEVQGMMFDLVVEQRTKDTQFQGLPMEVIEMITGLEMGIAPGTPRLDVNVYLAQRGELAGGTVPVGTEAEKAAKDGGLNIDALQVVTGNDTKH